MARTTNKHLEGLIDRLNEVTEAPAAQYVRKEGKLIPQAGHYYLAGAYGGVRVEQMSEGGGSRDPFNSGYCTKGALREILLAVLAGIEIGKKLPRRRTKKTDFEKKELIDG